jgi:phosphoglycolate phosphatase
VRRPAGIVFDLDGTLVDSRHDLAAAVNATRERLGLAPLAVAEVVTMVGEGARLLLRRALPMQVDGGAFEDALTLFLDLYLERCLDSTRPYPGIGETLAGLAGAGYPLALLTNKPERHSRKLLTGLGLAGRFSPLIGGDTLPARKPDPAGLRAVAAAWRVPVEELLLVGDSAVDVATSAAAGARTALVGWGYGREEQLAGFAGWRVRDAGELLAGLLPGRG